MDEEAKLGIAPPGNARSRAVIGNHGCLRPGDGGSNSKNQQR
jgi:hypothetical protein